MQAGKEDLSSFTFLYLAGLDDFHLDAAAVSALKKFFESGGTLLINNGLGMQGFDTAVRRELKKILPASDLSPVPPTHPIFSTINKITEAESTPAALTRKPGLKAPYLEGISLNGDLKVIYSPFDLEAGWQGMDHPLAKAYEPESAMKLGVNVIMYAMTH